MHLSVIVPAYNASKTIRRCVESIDSRKNTDYEIIIVENGSTDDTLAVCEDIKRTNDHVNVIHTETLGVSHARNIGIDNAQGEYIAFIDADDSASREAIDDYFQINSSDLAIFNYSVGENDTVKKKCDIPKDFSCNNTEALNYFFYSTYGFQGYVWNKLFRTDIIKHYNISFNDQFKYGEDQIFVVDYLLNCKNILFSTKEVYLYYLSTNSVTGEKIKNKVYAPEKMTAYSVMVDHIMAKNSDAIYACYYGALIKSIECFNEEITAKGKKYYRRKGLSYLSKILPVPQISIKRKCIGIIKFMLKKDYFGRR